MLLARARRTLTRNVYLRRTVSLLRPTRNRPQSTGLPGSIEEANVLAAFDSWELEIDRLYERLLKDHPELR